MQVANFSGSKLNYAAFLIRILLTYLNKLDGSHLLFLISFFNKSRIIPTQGKLKTTEFFNNMSRILKEKQLTSPTMTNRSTKFEMNAEMDISKNQWRSTGGYNLCLT